jgi:hypothetical protein
MSLIAQWKPDLSTLPASLSTSIGFIGPFAFLDLMHTYFRYRIRIDTDPSSIPSQVALGLGIGTLHTARFLTWLNYQFDDPSGFTPAIENLKNLPRNLWESKAFILGYAFLDMLYERAKSMALTNMDPSTWGFEATFQFINACSDVVNMVYWDNFVPPAYLE